MSTKKRTQTVNLMGDKFINSGKSKLKMPPKDYITKARNQKMSKPLKISEEAAVQMPMKTVASLIIIVALGTMGYFQMIERLNVADTRLQIMEKDLNENTEFRIKWPRGQLGSLPADSEQFMMIEDLYKLLEKLNAHIESMALNKVNIEFLRKQMEKF